MRQVSAAGVDGCRSSWICVAKIRGKALSAFIAPSIETLVARLPDDCVIGIDIPIGLPARDSRQCEILARRLVGPRRSSVFPVPLRVALKGHTREEACDLQVPAHGRGKRIGVQTWAIMPKIIEVDAYLRADLRRANRIIEVHPEVSFCCWNGGTPLTESKKTAPGRRLRSGLIDSRWRADRQRLEQHLAKQHRGEWALDDLYDAFAVLWTATRYARGESQCLPEAAELDSTGLTMRIVA